MFSKLLKCLFFVYIYRKWKLHRQSCQLGLCEISYPPVSILKPLTGVDPNLFSNLETFFTMNYPKVNFLFLYLISLLTVFNWFSSSQQYELLFCISDESDPSLMLVQSLMNKYPDVDASYYIGMFKIAAIKLVPQINKTIVFFPRWRIGWCQSKNQQPPARICSG